MIYANQGHDIEDLHYVFLRDGLKIPVDVVEVRKGRRVVWQYINGNLITKDDKFLCTSDNYILCVK